MRHVLYAVPTRPVHSGQAGRFALRRLLALDENLDLPRPFGPYTLLRRLAVGGMAEVYVGKTKGIGGFEKLVAIKVIHPRYSEDDHFITMLVEEAKISVLLNHVNIAQTFDLGCIDEIYYIVMEFIEGADAYRVMRKCSDAKKALPIDVAAFIASEMCAGLDYAHRKRDPGNQTPLGIVHRDISPQNILVSFAGEVKVVDFGIAKAASRSDHTEAGVIKGKYYYMSPEQAWGDPMDHRSDIFSTGVVLYELLTGRMLYNDDNIPMLLDKVRKAEIAPPEKRRPSIPKPLSDIVMRALQKDPADRYQSAQEMGHALTQFLYSTSPTFSAARLADLMALLFPADNAKISGNAGVPTSGEIALPAPMKGLEYEPKKEQSKLYSLADLGDEDEEDQTRNDVLPYRKVQQLRKEAQAQAQPAREPTPRPTNRPAPRDGGALAVDRPSVSSDGSWVSPIRAVDVLTTNPLSSPANEATDQVPRQQDAWEDPTHLRDKRGPADAHPGGDDFDDSTLIDQGDLYKKVQQALDGKQVVESARGRVNAGWAQPAGSADTTRRQAPLVNLPPQVVSPPRPGSVPPPPARAAWTARAPLPAASASRPAEPQRIAMPRPAPAPQRAPSLQPLPAQPLPAQSAGQPGAPRSSHTPIGFGPESDELTVAPLTPGYDSDISTRPRLGASGSFPPDDRTLPLAAVRVAPVQPPFPSGPYSSQPPASGGFGSAPPAHTSGAFATAPAARPAGPAGPWGTPAGHPTFDAQPQSTDPFAAPPQGQSEASAIDLGKPNPLRFVLWGLGAAILAVLAAVIVALLLPSGPEPQIQIVSTPTGALVSVDGEMRGTTPLTISDGLEVGRSYTVEVTLPEHQVWRASIQAQHGIVQQSALLAPLPATLHVDTIPPGAQILVGGAPRGVAPVDVVGFRVGQRVEVRASLPGHGAPVIQMVPITTATTSVTVTVP